MWVGMFVFLRTGGVIGLSAARFAVVTATILPQDDPPPQIAGQLEQFFREGHGLVEVRQEVSQ